MSVWLCRSGFLLAFGAWSAAAAASEPGSGFVPRFDVETARLSSPPAESGLVRLSFHGEYQLRGQLQSDVPLTPPVLDPGADRLGQKGKIYQWFRLTPRLQLSTPVEIVAQVDLLRGLAAGATTRYVEAAALPEAHANPVSVDPRWLYVEIKGRGVRVRAGQQPYHIGMGMVANDGDHPSLFGDYRQGDSAERVLVEARPAGRLGRLALIASGDLIYRDPQARLVDGDLAWQGLGGLRYGGDYDEVGAVAIVRRQHRRDGQRPEGGTFLDELNTETFDVHGRFAARTPGAPAYVFGEGEAAVQRGEVTESLSARERVEAFGAAVRLGVARERRGAERYADLVGSVGWGYASGDADPFDGVSRRFAMHPDFNVGLVLFDQVLHAKTARAATLGRVSDPVRHPPPGVVRLPSNGGVAGASYVNPTLVVRPRRSVDLKLGFLVAQATSDVVDPTAPQVARARRTFDGGPAARRDLGFEVDAGVEVRVPLSYGMSLQLGLQAGLLLPGGAFADADGGELPVQHLSALRVGFQY